MFFRAEGLQCLFSAGTATLGCNYLPLVIFLLTSLSLLSLSLSLHLSSTVSVGPPRVAGSVRVPFAPCTPWLLGQQWWAGFLFVATSCAVPSWSAERTNN